MKEGMEMGRLIPECIQRIEGQNYWSISTSSTQKRRKIQSGN